MEVKFRLKKSYDKAMFSPERKNKMHIFHDMRTDCSMCRNTSKVPREMQCMPTSLTISCSLQLLP